MKDSLARQLNHAVEEHRDRLIAIVQDLVRIPSENTAPTGAEGACQQYVADFCSAHGWNPELYEPDTVPGIREHALYEAGRDYRGRPNLAARKPGAGGGRSLLLSGHIDTVPRGSQNWTRNPFGGAIEDGRLYGRGSSDMKAGVATNLFAAELLETLGLRLRGDLLLETVVDEEFGGANGTLAGRLKGVRADAAVVSEPTELRICPAQRGGRTAHVTLRSPGGILNHGQPADGVIRQLACLLNGVERFAAERRRNVQMHPAFADSEDPVPVWVTKVITAPWGTSEPQTVAEECRVELYWQAMPGEKREDVDRDFFAWLDGVAAGAPGLFNGRPEVRFPIRWLPGSALAPTEPLVTEFQRAAAAALGHAVPVEGMDGPCDMFLFHAFGVPAILWGVSGGNAHAADEYVDVDSTLAAAQALVLFICEWCGLASGAA
jgi:acetylornithine deacetylase